MNIYLASPYTHENPLIREERYQKVCRAAGYFMLQGHRVFSPIAMYHPISLHIGNSVDGDFWLQQGISYLNLWANTLWILELPGYLTSEGIKIEKEIAESMNLPIQYVEEPNYVFSKT